MGLLVVHDEKVSWIVQENMDTRKNETKHVHVTPFTKKQLFYTAISVRLRLIIETEQIILANTCCIGKLSLSFVGERVPEHAVRAGCTYAVYIFYFHGIHDVQFLHCFHAFTCVFLECYQSCLSRLYKYA